MINLTEPNIRYKNQYIEMMNEFRTVSETPEPWVLKEDYSDFNAMVQKLINLSLGIDIPKGFVPSTTYWAYNNETNKIVGAINIRHKLNNLFLKTWGHIGFGVRPSEREKGYGAVILKLAITECKKMDIERVLLCCYKNNITSSKTILKNGGILENEIIEDNTGKIIQRYWISI